MAVNDISGQCGRTSIPRRSIGREGAISIQGGLAIQSCTNGGPIYVCPTPTQPLNMSR
jgi:hypothetical protein